MIPQLSATSIRQAMRWAGDERRLALACQAVLEFMQRHASAVRHWPGSAPQPGVTRSTTLGSNWASC